MVGAAPVCPPERPRSGVSIRKRHVPIHKSSISIRKRHIHIRKGGISIHKRCMLTPRHVCAFADGCALAGRRGRAHRHRPYQSPSYFATQSHTNKITIYMQSAQRKPTVHVQSAPTHLHQTTRCAITPSGLYFR